MMVLRPAVDAGSHGISSRAQTKNTKRYNILFTLLRHERWLLFRDRVASVGQLFLIDFKLLGFTLRVRPSIGLPFIFRIRPNNLIASTTD